MSATGGDAQMAVELPTNPSAGLYFVEASGDGGFRSTQRFVLRK